MRTIAEMRFTVRQMSSKSANEYHEPGDHGKITSYVAVSIHRDSLKVVSVDCVWMKIDSACYE